MKSSTATLLLSLATGVFGAGSLCPLDYPANLNTTSSGNGLIFTLASNSPLTNNRALQLRTNPNFEGGFYVGVDASSPVLVANLRGGGLYSQARNDVNQLYDLGPTGYLNQRDVVDGTTRFTVGFANATIWPGDVDAGWTLAGGSSTGTYALYHETGLEIVNGFVLCQADHSLEEGPWYQLFYYNYQSEPADFPECEFVGVRTTVGPTIYNGECDIGGFVAS